MEKEYNEMCEKFGKETVDYCIENAKPEELWWCMDAFSNDSFLPYGFRHRDKFMNKMEKILQEDTSSMYRTVTYGVCPAEICTSEIGKYTERKNGNVEIAEFLIRYRISDLKEWLMSEMSEYVEANKHLLHYYKEESE